MKALPIKAVESLPRKLLVGYCAILNDKAVRDYYEKLWANFIERIRQIPNLVGRELYGVCTNLQQNNFFEYWTTVECMDEENIPSDLVALPLDGGIYGSRIEKPEINLPLIYTRRISSWSPPADYSLDWKLPFFEVYRPDWFSRQTVKHCVPLNHNAYSFKCL
ncbi:MAG: effector binding domain-containing protein [Deltaproteobacteria bacterium]|jgi:predicted transcriptional regulator YdeE|nr:effector binding domain-containing protein [Deltaproteobacteria bacterium]